MLGRTTWRRTTASNVPGASAAGAAAQPRASTVRLTTWRCWAVSYQHHIPILHSPGRHSGGQQQPPLPAAQLASLGNPTARRHPAAAATTASVNVLLFSAGAVFAASNAALALAQLGDEGGATAEMQRVARRAPGSADMRAALAALYWSQVSICAAPLSAPRVQEQVPSTDAVPPR